MDLRAVASVKTVEDFCDCLTHAGDAAFEHKPALSQRVRAAWQTVPYGQLDARTRTLAAQLRGAGIGDGDRIALLGESSADWAVAFLGVLRAGGVAVPLDPKLGADELAPIVADAAPALVLADAGLVAVADALERETSSVGEVLLLGRGVRDDSHRSAADLSHEPSGAPREDAAARSVAETAMLVYTSGTTGTPKGVMLSLAGLAHDAAEVAAAQRASADDVYVSILPVNHTYELTCGLLAPLTSGAHVAYVGSLFPDEITAAIKHWRATRVVAVPLFLRLFKRGIERRVAEGETLRRVLFGVLSRVADVVPDLGVRHRLFGSLHRNLGGRLTRFYVGGAALDPDVARFFERVGVGVYQGYGLTETSPVISTCTPWANRLGSVGKPLPGVEVRIDDRGPDGEGEIAVRGPVVMQGYHGRPELTAEVLDDDGWFHTGDLGKVDGDGYVWVTGRSKNVIVLANGKNVQPEEVEAALERCPLVEEACVLATAATKGLSAGGEQVTAVVVPTEAALDEHPDADALANAVTTAARESVKHLAAFKRPVRILVRTEEFDKTPSRKIKREVVRTWVGTHA
ncbi:MAG: AMP-binding protein [Acidimicrobiia bacterium]